MKKNLFTMLLIATGYTATAQITAIPDPVFESKLIDLLIDSDGTVNGQIATSDALVVTSLTIVGGDSPDYIYNLTGIEAFTNLESLTINVTMIEELNVNSLVNLKILNCADNLLTTLDVSNNALLEELNLGSWGDVIPLNGFSEIDLSHNPNIKKLTAWSLSRINLKNGNNNPEMRIFNAGIDWGVDPSLIYNTCIEVDDAVAAQNNELPYSEWIINESSNQSHTFAETCEMGTNTYNQQSVKVYPNPASDVLYFTVPVERAHLIDMSGRVVREYNDVSATAISLSGIEKGMYLVRLTTGNATQTKKIAIK